MSRASKNTCPELEKKKEKQRSAENNGENANGTEKKVWIGAQEWEKVRPASALGLETKLRLKEIEDEQVSKLDEKSNG